MNKITQRIREDRSGFTLAELLIVVGILLVLIAIAVPVFSGALGNAEAAVASANGRSAKSEALTKFTLESDATAKEGLRSQNFFYDDKGNTVDSEAASKYAYTVTITKEGKDEKVTVTQTKPVPEGGSGAPGTGGVTE